MVLFDMQIFVHCNLDVINKYFGICVLIARPCVNHGKEFFFIDTICFSQVRLLKDILEAWKKEVEKKPPTMSIDEAYEVLNLPKGVGG